MSGYSSQTLEHSLNKKCPHGYYQILATPTCGQVELSASFSYSRLLGLSSLSLFLSFNWTGPCFRRPVPVFVVLPGGLTEVPFVPPLPLPIITLVTSVIAIIIGGGKLSIDKKMTSTPSVSDESA